MPRIYISYRGQDSGDIARRIYKYLVNSFSEEDVFKDEAAPLGVPWQTALRQALNASDVLIVVIGPDWLRIANGNQPRLFERDDFHRYEIETALSKGKRVIPLLVYNASLPHASDLPASIRDLANRMAFVIRSDPYFEDDMADLVARLQDTENNSSKENREPASGTNIQKGGSGNIQQNMGGVRDSVVIGTQINHPPPEPPKKDDDKKDSGKTQIILAIIGVISAVLVAFIGIVPALIPLFQSTPTPTATILAQSDMTATQAILQLTTDAQATETALLDVKTRTASQTQPTAAPTTSVPPSETSTSEATIQPTSASPTPIAVPTDIPAQSTGNSVTLTIYRDEDSFTLYVPQSSVPISLVGLEFRVTLLDGTTIVRRLDRDFAAYAGMPFSNISSLNQPICFRVLRSGANVPVPQDCQNGVLLLTQNITDADVFWRDRSTNVERTVMVYSGDQVVGTCAPQASCEVNWMVSGESTSVVVTSTITDIPTDTSTPTATPTPGYPCGGNIVSDTSALNQVHIEPMNSSPRKKPVQGGSEVEIVNSTADFGIKWYQIRYDNNTEAGWIQDRFLVPSTACPK